MSTRFRICLAVWTAVILWNAASSYLQAQPPEQVDRPTAAEQAEQKSTTVVTPTAQIPDEEWTIVIQPARGSLRQQPVVAVQPPAADSEAAVPQEDVYGCDGMCGTRLVDVSRYSEIYQSIPFNRAEYMANPSYRHDATMEILTGHPRQVTVVQHGTDPAVSPVSLRSGPTVIPYGFVRPSLRLNYYRHFPSLNPYWNMFWNFSGIR